MKRTIKDYLIDILNECEYLLERVKIFDYNEFLQNEDLKKAFIRSLPFSVILNLFQNLIEKNNLKTGINNGR
jgi:uncharacterized protein with HEPN domain